LDFVNREEELQALQNYYEGQAFQFIPIYGRRRVGKKV
jgi:AAA+ ATPase superfamily predicted ATPase